MDWFWNWGGECFGYRDGESLFIYSGREAGRFDGEEINGSNGRYLGEVMSDNRLISSRSKKGRVRGSFAPRMGSSYARYANYVGYVIYAGYTVGAFPGWGCGERPGRVGRAGERHDRRPPLVDGSSKDGARTLMDGK